MVYVTATRSSYVLANTSTTLPIGSGAVHTTAGEPFFVTVNVRAEAVAANVAFAPLWLAPALIVSFAMSSAAAFSHFGAPLAAAFATSRGTHTRSWLTR